ncbi:hypothetical protein AWB08_004042 [Escherichia coli]|nr:hypothetical protein [Escherichia coli]
MSRLSRLSERSAVAMCNGQPGPQARCLLSGEDDVSSHLSLYRECPSMTVTGIGKPPVSFSSVAVRACVLPCGNEKVLMVNPAANAESVVRLAAR